MLWWLLLLIIPLIVHLFNFRRYKTIIFSNTQFLKKIENQTRKLKQLKKYLLLGSRLGIFTCLVLAFGLPYCGKQQQKGLPKQYALFLDNSYSMGNELEQAKNQVRELVKQLNTKDKVTLITASNIPKTYADKATLLNEIDGIQLVPNGIDLNDVKHSLDNINSAGTVNLSSFIISDFQEHFMSSFNEKDSWNTAYFVPIAHTLDKNVALDSVYFANPFSNKNKNQEMVCVLHNYGKKDEAQVPLSLYLDNKIVASATVDLPAESTVNASLNFTSNTAKDMRGLVKIDIDDIYFDNELFWFAKNSDRQIKIAFVGEINTYIEAVFKTEPIYLVTNFSVVPENLSDYNAVIINGYVANAGNNGKLKSFVDQGGNILLLPSKGNNQSDFGNLGVSKWSVLNKTVQKISKINFNHPLYQFVYKSIPKNPVEPSISQFFSISTQGNGRPVLSAADESPILIDFNIAAGHVYQSAIPFDNSWSDFPLVGYLFYPTVSNIGLSSGMQKPLFGWLGGNGINKTVEIEPIITTGVERFELSNASKVFTAEIINSNGKTFLFPANGMQNAAVYDINNAIKKQNVGKVALNINRDESNIKFLSTDELQRKALLVGAEVYLESLAAHPVLKQNRGIINTTWKWFIVFALLFVLIEIFLLRFL